MRHSTSTMLMSSCLVTSAIAQAATNIQDDEIAAVQAWLDGLQKQHDRLREFANTDEMFHAKWTKRDICVPTPVELETMRRAVANHPDHPDRTRLQDIESRLASHTGSLIECWVGATMWRIATPQGAIPSDYSDFGGNNEDAWWLDPTSLSVTTSIPPSPSYDYARLGLSFVTELTYFFSGRLCEATRLAPVRVTRVVDGKWTADGASSTNRSNYAVSATGQWSPDRNSGTVDDVLITVTHIDGTRGSAHYLSSGWTTNEHVPTHATRVESIETIGSSVQYHWIYELDLLETTTREVLRRMSSVPSLNGDDPLRGRLTFRSLDDYRGEGTYTTWDQNGTLESSQSLSAISPTFARRNKLRLLGWIMCISIAVSLIALRARARARAS